MLLINFIFLDNLSPLEPILGPGAREVVMTNNHREQIEFLSRQYKEVDKKKWGWPHSYSQNCHHDIISDIKIFFKKFKSH